MKIFQFFKINKKLDEFALSLADEFIKANSIKTDKKSKKNDIKLAKANDMLAMKIKAFQNENKLGIYGKARVGNKFMWALREHGFEKEFSEDITRKLFHKFNEK